jgi:hypothetical protein
VRTVLTLSRLTSLPPLGEEIVSTDEAFGTR